MSAITKGNLTDANSLFKKGKNQEAIAAYTVIIDHSSSDDVDEVKNIRLSALLNRSSVYGGIAEFDNALRDAYRAKKMDITDTRVYTRLATAYQGQQEYQSVIDVCTEGLLVKSSFSLQSLQVKAEKALNLDITYPDVDIQQGNLSYGRSHNHNHEHNDHSHTNNHDHSHNHCHDHAHDHNHGDHKHDHSHSHNHTHELNSNDHDEQHPTQSPLNNNTGLADNSHCHTHHDHKRSSNNKPSSIKITASSTNRSFKCALPSVCCLF